MESQIFKTNTIGLDWGKLSRCSYKYAADFIVQQVGYQLTTWLKDVLRLDLRKINCVGHSLGNYQHFNSFFL